MKNKKIQNNESNNDSKIILFAILILLVAIVSFNFINPGITGAATNPNWEPYNFGDITKWLIGDLSDLGSNADIIAMYIIYLTIFIMLAAAFYDIIYGFTPFSRGISKILGVGLAIISVLTGLLRIFAHIVFAVTGGFGIFSIAVAIVLGFAAFLGWTKLDGLIERMKKSKELKEIKEEALTMRAGAEAMKEVGKVTRGQK